MGKYIVVCLDGTGNSPTQVDSEYATRNGVKLSCVESNVMKLWGAITGGKSEYQPAEYLSKDLYKYYGMVKSLDLGSGFKGDAVYINGVGSVGRKWDLTYEGATGTGTSARIRDAYRFVAERWEGNEDKICIFGFSRGAFAARSLAGFIGSVGLPSGRRVLPEQEIGALWSAYVNNDSYEGGLYSSLTRDVKIEFLGIWDTVGSLAFGETFNSFHKLSPACVKCVRHALALDEVRPHFAPTYWIMENGVAPSDQDVREVWFGGVHSNIGGGYQVESLSNIAYVWMLRELASRFGFSGSIHKSFEYEAEAVDIGWHNRRDSYKEFYSGWKKALALLKGGIAKRKVMPGQFIHPSVFEWMTDGGYSPEAINSSGAKIIWEWAAPRVLQVQDWILDSESESLRKSLS
ncbi:phospholipase effector Tle1 domain-containing protein [Pseudomonas paralcaligenes]|uniref:phospholipase effector Tle1 domain-containing protein n=1 Tax=Pseudomonas paralcaligenes TaxID=2772558 RepID=UPI001C7FF79D|nr:DUF2235 domain-containing protein [Pseudomonas paralcaligenes]